MLIGRKVELIRCRRPSCRLVQENNRLRDASVPLCDCRPLTGAIFVRYANVQICLIVFKRSISSCEHLYLDYLFFSRSVWFTSAGMCFLVLTDFLSLLKGRGGWNILSFKKNVLWEYLLCLLSCWAKNVLVSSEGQTVNVFFIILNHHFNNHINYK